MEYSREQVMLTLAMISYLGFAEMSSGLQGSERTFKKIDWALKTFPPVQGEWELLWGPAEYKLPLAIFDDNFMFVVRNTRSPAQYAIVIRGTNPVAISNWVLEDFSVFDQSKWVYSHPASSLAPKISLGTARGLQTLQNMKPADGLPGAGTNLYNFLASEVMRNPSPHLQIAVTGHSLGGALAPAVALWLADTQKTSDQPFSPPWDPGAKATIEVFPFAGPSPGNKDFAAYYDQRLGATTHRGWNQFDVVAHGWDIMLLKQLPSLYDPGNSPGLFMRFALWATTVIAHRGQYLHIQSEATALKGGKVSSAFGDYIEQMLWQHTGAYLELLELLEHIDVTEHLNFGEEMEDKILRASGRQKKAPGAAATPVAPEGLDGLPGYIMKALPESLAAAMPKLVGTAARELKRMYQVPATLMLHAIPETVSLRTLKSRQSHYHSQGGAERQSVPASPSYARNGASGEAISVAAGMNS